jgi:hypothetical protein
MEYNILNAFSVYKLWTMTLFVPLDFSAIWLEISRLLSKNRKGIFCKVRYSEAHEIRQYRNIIAGAYQHHRGFIRNFSSHRKREKISQHKRSSGESLNSTRCKIVLGEWGEDKLKKIHLSDSTLKRRIDTLAQDIKLQVLEKIKSSSYFANNCDNIIGKENCAQPVVCARYSCNESIEEEMLFSQPLKATTAADDIFSDTDNLR